MGYSLGIFFYIGVIKLIFVKKHIKEILLCFAWLSGWGLVTWTLSDLFGNWVFKLSGGLLLLGLVGYRFIFKILIDGLYVLSLKDEEEQGIEDKG